MSKPQGIFTMTRAWKLDVGDGVWQIKFYGGAKYRGDTVNIDYGAKEIVLAGDGGFAVARRLCLAVNAISRRRRSLARPRRGQSRKLIVWVSPTKLRGQHRA